MSNPATPLQSLHQQYCRLTGRNLSFQLHQRAWWEWSKHFVAADLDLVIAWINQENAKREKRYQIRSDLQRLIGDLAVFDSLRAEAELEQKRVAAKRRQVRPTRGAIELAAMRHEEVGVPEQPVKRISTDLIAESIRKAGNS